MKYLNEFYMNFIKNYGQLITPTIILAADIINIKDKK